MRQTTNVKNILKKIDKNIDDLNRSLPMAQFTKDPVTKAKNIQLGIDHLNKVRSRFQKKLDSGITNVDYGQGY